MNSPTRSITSRSSRYCACSTPGSARNQTCDSELPSLIPNLPRYAQPTISFPQHLSPTAITKLTDDSIFRASSSSGKTTIKAGASKRPRSQMSLHTTGRKSPEPEEYLIKRKPVTGVVSSTGVNYEPISFVQLFKSPKDDKEANYKNDNNNNIIINSNNNTATLTLGRFSNDGPSNEYDQRSFKSASYRSPTLIKKNEKIETSPSFNRDLGSIINETETLIDKMDDSDDNITLFSKEYLLGFVQGKQSVLADDWNKLVQYHFAVYEKIQEKIKVDLKLIQNVMELNNLVSNSSIEKENKLKDALDKIEILNSKLNELGIKNTNRQNHQNSFNPKTKYHNFNTPKEDSDDDIEIDKVQDTLKSFYLLTSGEIQMDGKVEDLKPERRCNLESFSALPQFIPENISIPLNIIRSSFSPLSPMNNQNSNSSKSFDLDQLKTYNLKSSGLMTDTTNLDNDKSCDAETAESIVSRKDASGVYKDIYQSEDNFALLF